MGYMMSVQISENLKQNFLKCVRKEQKPRIKLVPRSEKIIKNIETKI